MMSEETILLNLADKTKETSLNDLLTHFLDYSFQGGLRLCNGHRDHALISSKQIRTHGLQTLDNNYNSVKLIGCLSFGITKQPEQSVRLRIVQLIQEQIV